MKKITILLFAVFMAFTFDGWGQILTFEFNGLAGNETSAGSNSNDANITSSLITRGDGLTASTNADRFNATNWALTSIDNAVSGNDYMEFTITPNSGYQFTVSSIFIHLQRSSTGPSGVALRSSVDNYATNLDQEYSITDNILTQNFTFTFSQSNSTTSVTYRIYMWAESTGGSGGIGDAAGNDIIVNGTTSSTGPTITLSTSSLTGFSYVEGNGPSSEQSFTAEGSNLTNNISIAPPTNYEISTVSGVSFSATNPIILTQSSGSVATTPIYTRLKSGLSEGSYNNVNITATSSGATSKTVICSGDVIATVPDLLITEIMQNPADVTDANGEWFEIYNYGSTTVDINGFVIKDNGTNSHTINEGGSLNISAGSFLVMGNNITTATNGGVPVDYQYSDFTLTNTEDEIILYMTDGITEVDKVEWNTTSNWTVSSGASMIFIGQTIDDNNSYSNWTTSVQREKNYTNPGSETDFGSPSTNGLYQNLISTTTWTGTANWSEGNGVGNNNWSNGSPGSHVDVTINGDVTVDMGVISNAVCDDLTIGTGNSVTLSAEKALTVSGTFTNANTTVGDGLIIKSTSSGTGSLICSGTPSATVERFIEYGSSGKWNMLSPSTTSASNHNYVYVLMP